MIDVDLEHRRHDREARIYLACTACWISLPAELADALDRIRAIARRPLEWVDLTLIVQVADGIRIRE